MHITTEDCPVVDYNPAQYIPLNLLQTQWEDSKINAAERVQNPANATSLFLGYSSFAPIVLLISMGMISLSVMSVRAIAPQTSLLSYFYSPLTILAIVAFFVSVSVIYRRNRIILQLKNAADFAVMESARRYLKLRYGFLPAGWEDRFVSYLVNEEVKEDRFSETYQLSVRNFKGSKVLMVCNISGEAPAKN